MCVCLHRPVSSVPSRVILCSCLILRAPRSTDVTFVEMILRARLCVSLFGTTSEAVKFSPLYDTA